MFLAKWKLEITIEHAGFKLENLSWDSLLLHFTPKQYQNKLSTVRPYVESVI